MKKVKLLSLALPTLLMVASTSSAWAAPAVTGASGSLSTGSSAVVSGSGFGSHTMQVESLQNYIEAGTTGQKFTKSGWTQSDWTWASPMYATDASHSGNKSLKCSLSSNNNYNCAFAYVMPNPVNAGNKFYASWWVKYNGDTNGQWKMFKLKQKETIMDNPMEFVFFNWFAYQQIAGGADSNNVEYGIWPQQNTIPKGDNKWYRFEFEMNAGTTGSSNGSFTIRTTTDTGAIYEERSTGNRTHAKAGDEWRYAIWQNYIGNGINSAVIHLDDIYVQTGTQARVELCSGSTWSNRGKCEIQVPTSWSASSIPITVNTGNFTSGSSAYLYVVDSSGTANSSGYRVSVGGTSSGGNEPTPPPVTVPAPQLNSVSAQ
ncbi:MAG: hypothetical protein GXY53_00480 [Desulfobulbus sp.]|nr:hypothetical protein [Desulfobulbus sp.]